MRRRPALALLAGAALAPGCGGKPDRRLRVDVARVPPGGRLVLEHAGEPIELFRTQAGLGARSLLCSHYGCRVEWQPSREQYRCACHQGVFDAQGRPFAGPPTRPLRPIPLVVEGGTALVGEP